MSSVIVLTSLAALWLLGHQQVRHRFAMLKAELPSSYQSSLAVTPFIDGEPQLMALCVDLIRKEHATVPFDALSTEERRMVLHAHAVEMLPSWMSRYAAFALSPRNRRLINQLHNLKSSRPVQPKLHFGAIKHQQQLRSTRKS